MEWNRSDVLALAMEKCTICAGYGLRPSRNNSLTACNCVLRNIFRICFGQFKKSLLKKDSISRPNLEKTASPHRRVCWARKGRRICCRFPVGGKAHPDACRIYHFQFSLFVGS